MIRVHLKITPRAFERPRFRFGRGFNSPEYSAFKNSAGWLLRQAYRGEPLEGALAVRVLVGLKRPRSIKRAVPSVKPDIDNFSKAVLDLGNGRLWNDDAQIVYLEILKLYLTEAEQGIHMWVREFEVNRLTPNKMFSEDRE